MGTTGNPTHKTRPRDALILTVAFALMWIAFGVRLLPEARTTDFLNLYTGASLALDGDWNNIYTERGQLVREQKLVPERHDLVPFVRPPGYALMVAPLALMSFPVAFWIWMSAQAGALLGCWAWAWKRFGPEAAVWGALLMAGPLGIAAHGQDCALFLTVLCGAFVLGEKGRLFLCGLVLGLGLTKFHLFLLWPLILLLQRRWRILAGFAICGLGQALLSLALIGWSGLRGYAAFIMHLDRFYSPERYIDLNAILINTGLSYLPLLIILTALVVGLVLWCSRRSGPLWMTFTLATAGSLLIGPHAYGYDGTMLLLPAWCIIFWSSFRIARLAAAAICTPIGTMAATCGPPFAGFMALALLIFVVGVCVESEYSSRRRSRTEPGPATDLNDPAAMVRA